MRFTRIFSAQSTPDRRTWEVEGYMCSTLSQTEDYLDGSANIKMLVIGSPGSGKTRSASFWPKPIYADIEAGRGSLRDRRIPYVEIKNSQQMLSFSGRAQAPGADPQEPAGVPDGRDRHARWLPAQGEGRMAAGHQEGHLHRLRRLGLPGHQDAGALNATPEP